MDPMGFGGKNAVSDSKSEGGTCAWEECDIFCVFFNLLFRDFLSWQQTAAQAYKNSTPNFSNIILALQPALNRMPLENDG